MDYYKFFLALDIVLSSLLIFAVFRLCPRSGRVRYIFMALVLIFLYLHVISAIYASDSHKHLMAMLLGTFRPLGFLIGPLLYFYFMFLIRPNYVWKNKDWLHLTPAFMALVTAIPLYLTAINDKVVMLDSPEMKLELRIWLALMSSIGTVYLFFCYGLLEDFISAIKEEYACTERWLLGWLRACMFVTALIWTMCLVLCFHGIDHNYYNFVSLVFCFTTYVLAFVTMRRSWLVYRMSDGPLAFSLAAPGEPVNEDDVAQKFRLNDDQVEDAVKKIEHVLHEQKIYRNNQIRMRDLAGAIHLPEYLVSQIINASFKKNFFDLINTYRIKEAQDLLSQRAKASLSVLEIAYSVGFNSKSSFNAAFMKNLGVTPTEYRKEHLPPT